MIASFGGTMQVQATQPLVAHPVPWIGALGVPAIVAGKGVARQFGPVVGSVHCFDWVPLVELLKYAKVFITHGGFSSVREAIAIGIPTGGR